MNARRWRRELSLAACAASLALGGVASSCAARRTELAPRGPSLLADIAASPAYLSPAVWRYHPPRQATVRGERDLGAERVLYVGRRGERWIFDRASQRLEAGTSLAPEDLINVLELEHKLWFIGASGTAYEATAPLGRFLRSSAPLEPLVRVSAGGSTIVGIRADRSLVRSVDAAVSFAPTGPKGVEFADVELGRDGSGVALAVPERLYLTRDEGASFAVFDVPSLGAFGLTRDPRGELRVHGVLGVSKLVFAPAPALVPMREAELAPTRPPGVPARGPNAAAMAEGRALVLGDRYLELAPSERAGDFELWRGALDGQLDALPLPEAHGCRSVRLAGFGETLELACLRSPGDSTAQPVEFYRSEASPPRWQKEPFNAFGTIAALRLSMGASGVLIATGLCPLPKPGCAPSGVYVRRALDRVESDGGSAQESRQPGFEMLAAGAPSLGGVALDLAFAPDGRSAYAVGRRTKTSALAVFVSRDGGRNFEGQDLDVVRAAADEEDEDWDRTPLATRVESMAAAEDGTLALVLADRRTRTLVVVDERAHVLSTAKPPEEHALLSAVGLRAFAVSPATRRAWESLDGGVTWSSIGRFPTEICPGEANCDVPVRCVTLGCVIGAEVSRIGWGGQRDQNPEILPPPSSAPAEANERKLGVPLSCMLDEAGFRPLAGVTEFPSAHDAALGNYAWTATSIDLEHAAVSAVHAFGAPRPRVEFRPLLEPLSDAEGRAFTAIDQVEGVAALRYVTPQAERGDTHLRGLELAWDNAFEGRIGHAQLPDGGAYSPGDFVTERGRFQRADPDLLSIAEGGLYLRVHHAAGSLQETWFVDGKTLERVPVVHWPDGRLPGARAEMAHVAGAHVPLMLYGRGMAVLRARPEAGAFQFDAMTTGLFDPGAFGLAQNSNISYVAGVAGLYVETRELGGARARASVFPFRKDGPVLGPGLAVPTQLDLGERPKACSPAEASNTPRVVAAYLPGTRHAVVVSDVSDPPRLLLTRYAVLHGTPQEPCASAYDAEPLQGEAGAAKNERALLFVDDLEHSYLFRGAPDPSGETSRLEYRAMRCRFDPTLEVPADVFRAPGTSAPR